MAEQTQPDSSHRSSRKTGRLLVLFTLSLFLVVPAIAYLAWSLTRGEPQRLSLDYDQRADWFMMPVKQRPLTYNMFVEGETGKKYKKTDLHIDPEVEQVLQACVRLAQSDDFFDSADARDRIANFAQSEQNGFYPAYLLASWHQVNGDDQAFNRWIRVAYDRAGGAIAQRLVDEAGNPVADYQLPPVAIGYDRVIDGELNPTLVLVYPAPTSEDTGYVYLPTYRSVYRLADPDLPLGVNPGIHPIRLTLLPQPSRGEQPNWFAVPDGAVGLLPEAVIDDAP